MAAANPLPNASAEAPELRADPRDRITAPRESAAPVLGSLAIAVVVIAAGVGGWMWWRSESGTSTLQQSVDATAAPKAITQPSPPVPAWVAGPSVDATPADAAAFGHAVADLLGPAGAPLLVMDDLPRRLVSTLDSLGRAHAPVAAWPVSPAPGQLQFDTNGDSLYLSASNAARYELFARAAESVDAHAAVALYVRWYPLLQASYRQLGFGGQQLNDRVHQVIDLLLATPDADRVQILAPQAGSTDQPAPEHPQYIFAQPQLESLAAGQKMLLRMGPDHARRLKAVLRALRTELAQAETPHT